MPGISSLLPAKLMTQDRDEHGGVKCRRNHRGKCSSPCDVSGGGGDERTETKTGEKKLLCLSCLSSHNILFAGPVNVFAICTGLHH